MSLGKIRYLATACLKHSACCVVGRAIVDDKHLHMRKGLREDAAYRFNDIACTVENRNYHADECLRHPYLSLAPRIVFWSLHLSDPAITGRAAPRPALVRRNSAQ